MTIRRPLAQSKVGNPHDEQRAAKEQLSQLLNDCNVGGLGGSKWLRPFMEKLHEARFC